MLHRFFRALKAFIEVYGFYKNPLVFTLGLVAVLVLPYLTYILWGSALVFILAAVGFYFLMRKFINWVYNKYSYPKY